MKRLLIFGLLGPQLGFMTLLVIVEPISRFLRNLPFPSLTPENVLNILPGLFVFAPFAFIVGVIPALIVAGLDWFLDNRMVKSRWLLCGLLGMIVSLPTYKGNGLLWSQYEWWPLVGGLIGGIPGVICSWLSGQKPLAQPDQSRNGVSQ